jgi:hypothetical protein
VESPGNEYEVNEGLLFISRSASVSRDWKSCIDNGFTGLGKGIVNGAAEAAGTGETSGLDDRVVFGAGGWDCPGREIAGNTIGGGNNTGLETLFCCDAFFSTV